MIRRKKVISGIALSGLLAIAMLMQGCVTPIEIKQASKAQIELINAVDEAVVNLQTALNQFHNQKEARILEEGRMQIAQQAIDVSISQTGTVTATADELFKYYNKNIQPYIDYAFDIGLIDAEVKILNDKISKESDPVKKGLLQMRAQDLDVVKAKFAKKDDEIVKLEESIMKNRNNEVDTAKDVYNNLNILRGQVAFMKMMHGKVDAWLAIDISPTQEQVDKLKESVTTAINKIKKGDQQ